jgi:hypothetical protein
MVLLDVTVGSHDRRNAISLVAIFAKYGRFEGEERCRVDRNIKEIGTVKFSAVNNSMNKRREHQIIVFR